MVCGHQSQGKCDKLTSAGDLVRCVVSAADEVIGEPVSVLLCLPLPVCAAPNDAANLQ